VTAATRVPWLFQIKGHVEAGHKVLAVVADANRAEFYRDELVTRVGGAGWQTSVLPGPYVARHSSGGLAMFAPHPHLLDRLRGHRFDDWTCEAGLTLTRDENAALASIVLGEPAFDSPVLPPKPGVFTGESDRRVALVEDDLRWAMQLRAMRGEIDHETTPKAQAVLAGLAERLAAAEHASLRPFGAEDLDDRKAGPVSAHGIAAMVRLPGETDDELRTRLKALLE
jgi:hypothetical protein